MANLNTIQIKRGSGAPTATALSLDGELGYDKTNKTLYINNNGTIEVPFASVAASNITWGSQTANTVLAAPNGSNGTPSFRALAAADIPDLNASKITAGTLPVAQGGTGLTSLNTFVRTTGNQTIEGVKTFLNSVYVGGYLSSTNGQEYSALYFRSPSFGRVNTIQTVISNNAGNRIGNRFQFLQYSYTENTATTLDNYDAYVLPTVAAGKTGNNTYEILTSKNVVTVAQGGTGLTSLDTFVRTTGAQTITGVKTFNNNIILSAVNIGLLLTDSGGNRYSGFVNNSSNLWIGAGSTSSIHHIGGTYISAGLSSSDTTKGNPSIYICVPTRNDTTYSGTNYQVFHKGNLTYGTGNPSGGTNGDVYIKYTA